MWLVTTLLNRTDYRTFLTSWQKVVSYSTIIEFGGKKIPVPTEWTIQFWGRSGHWFSPSFPPNRSLLRTWWPVSPSSLWPPTPSRNLTQEAENGAKAKSAALGWQGSQILRFTSVWRTVSLLISSLLCFQKTRVKSLGQAFLFIFCDR